MNYPIYTTQNSCELYIRPYKNNPEIYKLVVP
jgi:hypothetical protein